MARTASIGAARQWVATVLDDSRGRVGDELRQRLILVTSELFTNAVQAVADYERVVVELEVLERSIAVTVINRGRLMQLPRASSPAPSPTADGGRGIGIIHDLADSVVAREVGLSTDPLLSVRAEFVR